jgi:PAS domain S-box-containing protein
MLLIGWIKFVPSGEIVESNSYAKELFGCQMASDMDKLNFWRMVADSSKRLQLKSDLEKLQDVSDVEVELIRENRENIWVRLNIHSHNDSEMNENILECAIENITSQIELRRENKQLELIVQKQRRLADALGRIILSTSLLQDLQSLLMPLCGEAVAILSMSSAHSVH